jgi:hypothetical protein
MTLPTREQQVAIELLREQQGQENLLSIEHRDADEWPHGIVRIRWSAAATLEGRQRTLYINPDGTRLTWETIQHPREEA